MWRLVVTALPEGPFSASSALIRLPMILGALTCGNSAVCTSWHEPYRHPYLDGRADRLAPEGP